MIKKIELEKVMELVDKRLEKLRKTEEQVKKHSWGYHSKNDTFCGCSGCANEYDCEVWILKELKQAIKQLGDD